MPDGIKVLGPIKRTLFPNLLSNIKLERATRECAISPQMAIESLCILPLALRIVKASKRACVGCSCKPSPAFITEQLTFSANSFTAPDCGWRTTIRSGFIAFNVNAVSIRVSPFLIDDACMAIFITSAPRRFPASSKEACVLVEFSKNILI